jgi:hypothetical protein
MGVFYHGFPNNLCRDGCCGIAGRIADVNTHMPMLIILGIGGALCGWSVLLMLSGERQRKMAELLNTAPPVDPKKKN